jgi:hypothetical protein
MSLFLLKLTSIVIFALVIISFVAPMLGSNQPPSPILQGFFAGCGDQPQPCWNGIHPGITTAAKAQIQLELEDYKLFANNADVLFYSNNVGLSAKSQSCSIIRLFFTHDTQIVSTMSLNDCDGLMFGDLLILGFPEKMVESQDVYVKVGEYYVAEMSQNVVVDEHYMRIEWSPTTNVNSLYIGSSTKGLNESIDLMGNPWHGFAPHWRYCQIEPQSQGCQL